MKLHQGFYWPEVKGVGGTLVSKQELVVTAKKLLQNATLQYTITKELSYFPKRLRRSPFSEFISHQQLMKSFLFRDGSMLGQGRHCMDCQTVEKSSNLKFHG